MSFIPGFVLGTGGGSIGSGLLYMGYGIEMYSLSPAFMLGYGIEFGFGSMR